MPELKQYKEENVLEQITARLVPPDKTYPDSMCELLLTNRHFYVLEDNYDGTYIEYFAFPLNRIEVMKECAAERYNGTGSTNSTDTTGDSTWRYVATAALGLIGGFIVLPVRGNYKTKTKYLEIKYCDYSDKSRQKNTLYFKDYTQSVNKFIKAFRAGVSAEPM